MSDFIIERLLRLLRLLMFNSWSRLKERSSNVRNNLKKQSEEKLKEEI